MDEPYSENPNLDHAELGEPELAESGSMRPRWQFSLLYLFLLTTVVAALAAMARAATEDPFIAIALVMYASVIMFYLIFRLPMLLFYGPELRRIRENRRKLAQWTAARRQAKRAEELSREEAS